MWDVSLISRHAYFLSRSCIWSCCIFIILTKPFFPPFFYFLFFSLFFIPYRTLSQQLLEHYGPWSKAKRNILIPGFSVLCHRHGSEPGSGGLGSESGAKAAEMEREEDEGSLCGAQFITCLGLSHYDAVSLAPPLKLLRRAGSVPALPHSPLSTPSHGPLDRPQPTAPWRHPLKATRCRRALGIAHSCCHHRHHGQA